jgi:hypothetical protein
MCSERRAPRLFEIEPPRSRLEAVRRVDLTLSNNRLSLRPSIGGRGRLTTNMMRPSPISRSSFQERPKVPSGMV